MFPQLPGSGPFPLPLDGPLPRDMSSSSRGRPNLNEWGIPTVRERFSIVSHWGVVSHCSTSWTILVCPGLSLFSAPIGAAKVGFFRCSLRLTWVH